MKSDIPESCANYWSFGLFVEKKKEKKDCNSKSELILWMNISKTHFSDTFKVYVAVLFTYIRKSKFFFSKSAKSFLLDIS